ncbi:MAG TPA: lytic polysaccharide monooxygenase [Catenuloplanes sp.]
MSSRAPTRRPLIFRAVTVAVTAVVVLATALTSPASAHGNVVDPPSRNRGCLDRWATNHMSPQMASTDPMCHQAWQADPNAMWNWNGLFREGVGGNHQGAIPDGQLCSGGRTQAPRYNSLDAVGAWQAKAVGNNFSVKLFDQASHGADYIRVYVTRQGFNALTQPLRWADLELRSEIGNTPAARWQPDTGGVSISVPATAPGRTGRHIVYTIWQASHLDQSYYFCSDVTFGGGGTTPTDPPPVSPPPVSPPPVSPPPVSPPPTDPPPGSGSCSATYNVTGQWSGGFQAEVRVAAGSSAITGWRVTMAFANGQQVAQSWNTTTTTSGSTVTAANVSHNGRLGAGGSTTFGFLGSWNGSNNAPTVSCSAA